MKQFVKVKDHFSQKGHIKVPVATLFMRGGLKIADRTQKVVVDIYEADGQSNAKVVLHFGIADVSKEDVYVEPPKSLRFNDAGEVQALVNALNRAKLIMAAKQGALDRKSMSYRLHRDIEQINQAYKEAVKEENEI